MSPETHSVTPLADVPKNPNASGDQTAVKPERDGIRILGGVVACLAIPVAVLGIIATRRAGGHDVAYLAWVGGRMFLAGVAAFRGSRAAAVAISAVSALVAAALVWIVVRTPAAGTVAIVANVMMAALLLAGRRHHYRIARTFALVSRALRGEAD